MALTQLGIGGPAVAYPGFQPKIPVPVAISSSSPFIIRLLPLFDTTLVARVGTLDGSGTWTAAGAGALYRARIEGGPHMVRSQGQEVVSRVLVLIAGVLASHDASLMRFNLPPSPWSPQYTNIQAMHIDPISDETGVISAEIYLP